MVGQHLTTGAQAEKARFQSSSTSRMRVAIVERKRARYSTVRRESIFCEVLWCFFRAWRIVLAAKACATELLLFN
jgi:hypothetical protein